MNSEQYKEQFGILSSSGVGVILTRTREPFRAFDALKEWAFANDLPWGLWNIRDGWSIEKPQDPHGTKPKTIPLKDPYQALMAINDVGGTDKKFEKGIYVMHAMHHWTEKHPGIIECLKHYVRDLSEQKNFRVVLIQPECKNLPDDLKHDIPILDYDLPDHGEREAILDYIIDSYTPENEDPGTPFTKEQRDTLIGNAGGMTEMEIETAFSKGIVLQKSSWPNIDFDQFNRVVLESKTEVVKNSEVLEMMDSVPMSDVGGLEIYKRWITTCSKCFSKEASDFGVSRPKGAVVIGPPGSGKSLIAKATGSVLGIPIIKFDVSCLFASYVGQSEERARSAIKTIESCSPVIVLVDEIDKGLGGAQKSQGDSGVAKRVLGVILTAMQDSKATIFWVAAANRADSLPAELLRKGRFDEVFAALSPNRVEREAIFDIHLRKAKQDPKKIKDLDKAVDASKGYVGAEIEAVIKEAVKVAFVSGQKVTGQMMADQLSITKPLSLAFPEDFRAMEEWAENNARPASLPVEEKTTKVVRKRVRRGR